MKAATLAFLIIALCGCSSDRFIQRWLDKHPEYKRTDTLTVYVHDTIPADTLIKWEPIALQSADTFHLENDRQEVTIARVPTGSPCDTARIRLDLLAATKPVEIHDTIPVPYDRIVPCPPGHQVEPWWRTAAIIGWTLLAILVLLLWGLSKSANWPRQPRH